jgi:flagellar secretion chaperone FliS
VRLVICLYEQAIEDLRRALAAHLCGSIEGRTREINHAILVLGYLQSSLDKDRGGEVAANLDRFYNHVRTGLIGAHHQQSAAALEMQISHLMLVYEAWCEVERDHSVLASANPIGAPSLDAASSRAASSPQASGHAASAHTPSARTPSAHATSAHATPDQASPAEGEPHSFAEWDA